MLTIEEMQKQKRKLGYSYQTIAEKSGLPLGTVQKVLGGYVKSPRESTLTKLSNILDDSNRGENPAAYDSPYASDGSLRTYTSLSVRETSVYKAKKQGEFTVEDYEALPDDQRVELIDGVFYDMPAPQTDHQALAGEIYLQLKLYIREKGGSCMPFISPLDVQLNCDDKTMMEPDVLIVCDRSKLRRKRIYGAPDFIVEVLSPSTKKKDRFTKLTKYKNAGVREYWMIDIPRETIIVYDFEHDDLIHLYTFDDVVPVAIYDGDCTIDFRPIKEELAIFAE